MSEASHDAVRAARDLRLALDQLSDACVEADLERMLAAEASLAVVLSYLHTPLSAPTDPDALMVEIEALQRARARAERVGSAFDDLVRVSIEALAPVAVYDRGGRERAAVLEPAALEARG